MFLITTFTSIYLVCLTYFTILSVGGTKWDIGPFISEFRCILMEAYPLKTGNNFTYHQSFKSQRQFHT